MRFAGALASMITCMAWAEGSACSTATSSGQVRTAKLVALIDITAEQPSESVVSADVVISGQRGQRNNAHVVLEEGDRLHAHCAGETRELKSIGNGTYEAKFARAQGECVIALAREADVSAPRSVGTLPAPFEITSEFGERPLSRANDTLTLSWQPGGSDSQITIELEGDCIHSEEFQVAGDPGIFLIDAGKLSAWTGQERESCAVAVRVVQLRKGQADPALDRDSSVVLRQIRTTRFVSSP